MGLTIVAPAGEIEIDVLRTSIFLESRRVFRKLLERAGKEPG
jgi:hypothetical protein